ncbi:MAG: putative 2OG-Fe(II) oxygenase [Pseudomonadota bacterium]
MADPQNSAPPRTTTPRSPAPNPATPEALLEQAVAARQSGDLDRAAQALDDLLAVAPRHPVPLRLRARVALERAEPNALARFDTALRADPGNADLHLGKAQALDVAGDTRGAQIVARQIAEQAPGFTEALTFLSSLHLASGEADFTAPFAAAVQKAPQDPNIRIAWIDALAGIERFAEAAEIAAQARAAFAHEPHFVLLEAIQAGSAGEWARAEALFAELQTQSLQRHLAEARHRLRAGEWASAQTNLDHAFSRAPREVAAWALQGLLWRLDARPEAQARARWLHEQAGLVQFRPLLAEPDVLDRARARLEELHRAAGMPLNQSLRGGSQTRGVLFQRSEPALAALHVAIRATLEAYRADLPPADPAHPLLAQRETPWKLAGSWSVRLTGGGDHHAAHIHPAGLISSALYLTVPSETQASEEDAEHPGWLELGRAPADLGLTLDPLTRIRPIEGYLALFPSTLYHGTRPFTAGTIDAGTVTERLTVAFDVITNHPEV